MVIRKIIGWYLFLGGLLGLVYYTYKTGFAMMLVYLIPTIIAFIFLIINIVAGLKLLKDGKKKESISLAIFALILQIVQVYVFGVTYFNYFGPYIAIGFTDTPNFELYFRWACPIYFFRNGFEKGVSEIMILINVIPLLLIYLLEKKKSKLVP